MSLGTAIYAHLASDATLGGFLAQYQGGPAIFHLQLAPPRADRPFLLIPSPLSEASAGFKNPPLREARQEVLAYTDNAGSLGQLSDISSHVFRLLDEETWLVDGEPVVLTEVSGPAAAPAGTDINGHSLFLRVIYPRV